MIGLIIFLVIVIVILTSLRKSVQNNQTVSKDLAQQGCWP